jgi:hypothetical protein
MPTAFVWIVYYLFTIISPLRGCHLIFVLLFYNSYQFPKLKPVKIEVIKKVDISLNNLFLLAAEASEMRNYGC